LKTFRSTAKINAKGSMAEPVLQMERGDDQNFIIFLALVGEPLA
jgi:hypothetical protein